MAKNNHVSIDVTHNFDLDFLDLTIFQNHTNYITKLRDNISTIDHNF